ncbi:sensor histidine kinase [Neorhizobium sp. NPDC001467]|uniref:sensor histidine kinase n=1 Tax=Neorhizobium sp. NPDC001467 TaxID=3390595 RepID=UPI003D014837
MGRFSHLFPKATIGAYLTAFAAVIALPLIGFVVFLMLQLEHSEREVLNAETAQDAQLLGRTIDRDLRDMATTLTLLGNSPELERGELEAFHRRTQDSLRGSSLYALLVAEDGQLLLNTRVPFETALGKMGNLPSLASALRSGRTEVSDVFRGATSGNWVFNLTHPLPREMAGEGAALILTQNVTDLKDVLSTEGLPPGWSAAVVDQTGKVVAVNGASNLPIASAFPADTLLLMRGENGTIEDVGGSPKQMYGYYIHPEWAWRVIVWGPIASAQATILSTWRSLIVGSLVLLLIGFGFASLVGRQLRVSIREIAAMAERIGRGEIVSPVDTKIVEANQVAIALSNASFDRSQAEDRIHLILHELVHRTKNILTLIQAMMRQLARQGTTMEEFQTAISTRLQGLGRSIEALAREQWAGVPMRRVIEIHLANFDETLKQVDMRGEDFTLKAEAVQNLGLILHELTTNSMKYGALSTPHGRVLISWGDIATESGEQTLKLVWSESGGPPVRTPSSTGFGTTIIKRHAAAAFVGRADVDYLPEGFRWTLTAPRNQLERTAEDRRQEAAKLG